MMKSSIIKLKKIEEVTMTIEAEGELEEIIEEVEENEGEVKEENIEVAEVIEVEEAEGTSRIRKVEKGAGHLINLKGEKRISINLEKVEKGTSISSKEVRKNK